MQKSTYFSIEIETNGREMTTFLGLNKLLNLGVAFWVSTLMSRQNREVSIVISRLSRQTFLKMLRFSRLSRQIKTPKPRFKYLFFYSCFCFVSYFQRRDLSLFFLFMFLFCLFLEERFKNLYLYSCFCFVSYFQRRDLSIFISIHVFVLFLISRGGVQVPVRGSASQ